VALGGDRAIIRDVQVRVTDAARDRDRQVAHPQAKAKQSSDAIAADECRSTAGGGQARNRAER
jgi:hypothetical protein